MTKIHSPITQSSNRSSEHVLLLPIMAKGHLIPFVALARLLEQRTPYTITIINTPLNIKWLRSSLPPDTTIRLAELPFNGSDHGLPPNSENTNSLPPHLRSCLLKASESLQPAFERFVSAFCNGACPPPLCIVSDLFMSWSVQTARKFGVFHSVFDTSGAYGTAIIISLWTHLPHKQTDTDEFSLPDFEDVKLHHSQLTQDLIDADGTDPRSLVFRKLFSFAGQSDGVLVNTVEGLESKALQQLRKNLWRRVWAIGPLLTPPSTSSPLSCAEWLNQHPANSVLYISFGSQNSIHPSQMMELAKGLEACGRPFIWVIRIPLGFDVNDEFRAEWLPEGFEDRITERKQGVLVKKWAPQIEILSHISTGAFLSHCGWNSILESLSRGVPIIGWPMSAEQFYNSKLLEEELGVGVEIARGNDAEIQGVEMGRVFGWVMDGEYEKGMEMRRKAKQIAEIMKAATVEEEGCRGSSVRAIEDFVQTSSASW